jgi:hypothetical protein
MTRELCAIFAVVAFAIPGPTRAQPVSGFYASGGGGLALPQQQPLDVSRLHAGSALGPGAPRTEAEIGGPDANVSGSAGWGTGGGLRMEVEGLQLGRSNAELPR